MHKKLLSVTLLSTLLAACGGGGTGSGGDNPPAPVRKAKAQLELNTNIPNYAAIDRQVYFNADIKNIGLQTPQALSIGSSNNLDITLTHIQYPQLSGVEFKQINTQDPNACYDGQVLSVNDSCHLAVRINGSQAVKINQNILINLTDQISPLAINTDIEFVESGNEKLALLIDEKPALFMPGSRVEFTVINPKANTQPINNIQLHLNLPNELMDFITEENLKLTDSLNPGQKHSFSFKLMNTPEVIDILKKPEVIDALINNDNPANDAKHVIRIAAANSKNDLYPSLNIDTQHLLLNNLEFYKPDRSQLLSITNQSDATLAFKQIAGLSQDFTITKDNCQNKTLNSGDTCHLEIATNTNAKANQLHSVNAVYSDVHTKAEFTTAFSITTTATTLAMQSSEFLENSTTAVTDNILSFSNDGNFPINLIAGTSFILSSSTSNLQLKAPPSDLLSCLDNTTLLPQQSCFINAQVAQNAAPGAYTLTITNPALLHDQNITLTIEGAITHVISGAIERLNPNTKRIPISNPNPSSHAGFTADVSQLGSYFKIYDNTNGHDAKGDWCTPQTCPSACDLMNTELPPQSSCYIYVHANNNFTSPGHSYDGTIMIDNTSYKLTNVNTFMISGSQKANVSLPPIMLINDNFHGWTAPDPSEISSLNIS